MKRSIPSRIPFVLKEAKEEGSLEMPEYQGYEEYRV